MMKHCVEGNLENLDPFALAKRHFVWSGNVASGSFQRLNALMITVDQEMWVKVQFGHDEQYKPICQLHIKATLRSQCERCGTELALARDLSEVLQLVPEQGAASDALSGGEACEVLDNSLNIIDVIEDSLLLSLPIQLAHNACGIRN